MRRLFIGLMATLTIAGPFALGGSPAQAAPPGPQCVLPCAGPVEKVTGIVEEIVRTCQKAYCQFP